MQQNRALVFFAAIFVLACLGCQQGAPEPAAAVVERVENPQVGVALAALPPDFKVEANQGSRFELVPAAEGGTGRLAIVAGVQETGGINLVAAVELHKEQILARQGGEYKGQRELGSHLGTAFYSRGHYPEGAGITEETVIFLVHPWGDRTLQLIYRYPAADDSKQRIEDQLFAVMGEIEPLASPAAGPAEVEAGEP